MLHVISASNILKVPRFTRGKKLLKKNFISHRDRPVKTHGEGHKQGRDEKTQEHYLTTE